MDQRTGLSALLRAHTLTLNIPARVNTCSKVLSKESGSTTRHAMRAITKKSNPGAILDAILVTLDRIRRLQRLRSTAPPTLRLAMTAYLLVSSMLGLTTNTKFRFEKDLPSLRIAIISCELRSVASFKVLGIPAAFLSTFTSEDVLRGYLIS